MFMRRRVSVVLTTGFLIATPIAVEARPDFSMIGEWSGSPDCPITFYRDDGKNAEGNCDNGTVSHDIKGQYSSEARIDVTITRTDPNGCVTSVPGYIQLIDTNTVKYWQRGWNGCGVRTPPATQVWSRK